MQLQRIPELRPGTVLLFRPTRDGMELVLQRAAGYEFVSSGDVNGFVQDARVMLRVLSQLDMPRTWYRAWLGMLSLQEYNQTWQLRMTQDDLSRTCKVPRPKLSEPLRYLAEIGWYRQIKRGVIQLNPWLSHCGTSNAQAAAQEAWLAADDPEFVIPASDHPSLWRAREAQRREAQRRAASAGGQLHLVLPDLPDTDSDDAAEGGTQFGVAQYDARPAQDAAARTRRSAGGIHHPDHVSITSRVRAAFDRLGADASTNRIQEIVSRAGPVNPSTLKSAISRERARRQRTIAARPATPAASPVTVAPAKAAGGQR